MNAPSKRYLVAQTTTSKPICICRVEEIAALLNAKKIQEDYVARDGSIEMLENSSGPWVTIAQLLADNYRDKPIITVVLKDVENNTFLISERYYSDHGPYQMACRQMA